MVGCFLVVLIGPVVAVARATTLTTAATATDYETPESSTSDASLPPPFFATEEWDAYRRCSIPRYTERQWRAHFGPAGGGLPALYPTPVILVRADHTQAKLRHATRRTNLAAWFPRNFTVTVSSSNSFSEHKRTVLLSEYLDHVWEKKETPLQQSANDTWYLFGETYSAEWEVLLSHHALPPCTSCSRDTVAVSFGVGNAGSGVSWHTHGPGFSESLHGSKHWLLYPPSIVATLNNTATTDSRTRQTNDTASPIFHDKDQSSRQWMHDIYPYIYPKPWQCTVRPNEALYFPHAWWHATINLDRYTAFVSTFTTEHLAPQSKATLTTATGSRQRESQEGNDPFPFVPEKACDAQ
jgi:Cupin-like domain